MFRHLEQRTFAKVVSKKALIFFLFLYLFVSAFNRVEASVNQKNRTEENLRKKEKELYELKNGYV